MKWNIFERKSAIKLRRYSSEVDAESVWENIQPELVKKKDNRSFLLFWLLGFFLISFTSISFLLNKSEEVVSVGNSKDKSNLKQKNIASDITYENIKSNMVHESEPLEESTILKLTETPKNLIPLDHEPIKISKQFKPLKFPKTAKVEVPIVNTIKDNTSVRMNSSFAKKHNEFLSLNSIPSQAIPLFENNIPIPESNFADSKIIKIDLDPAPLFHLTLGVFAGIAQSVKSYEAEKDDLDSYVSLRKKTEKQLETFTTGIYGSLNHKSGLYFKSGLNFTKINERFSMDEISSFTENENVLTEIYTDQNGIEQLSYSNVAVNKLGQEKITNYNSHTLVSIPAILGYKIELSKFSVAPELGLLFNIRSNSKGKILSGQTINSIINLEEEEYYKSDASFSYYGGLQIMYKLSRHCEIGVSPFYTKRSGTINEPIFEISEFYNSTGIRFLGQFSF